MCHTTPDHNNHVDPPPVVNDMSLILWNFHEGYTRGGTLQIDDKIMSIYDVSSKVIKNTCFWQQADVSLKLKMRFSRAGDRKNTHNSLAFLFHNLLSQSFWVKRQTWHDDTTMKTLRTRGGNDFPFSKGVITWQQHAAQKFPAFRYSRAPAQKYIGTHHFAFAQIWAK